MRWRCPNAACRALRRSSTTPAARSAARGVARGRHRLLPVTAGLDGRRDAVSAQESPSDVAPATAPALLGRFQVGARLRSGAFGTVYRAYDPNLEREVALKTGCWKIQGGRSILAQGQDHRAPPPPEHRPGLRRRAGTATATSSLRRSWTDGPGGCGRGRGRTPRAAPTRAGAGRGAVLRARRGRGPS